MTKSKEQKPKSDERRGIRGIRRLVGAWACAVALVGCNLTDDQPPVEDPGGSDGGTAGGAAACLEAAAELPNVCLPGMYFLADYDQVGW